ncbi:MAG: 30S ribosome-binding factor RbfA [Myxococcota bacterium]|nr:30S ribosome-binding factor RbfA [Myxococcota bacterium]
MSDFSRTERVSTQVHRALSEVLLRNPPRDPRVTSISILRVKVSPDLRLARVYFLPLGHAENPLDVQAGLRSASGYLGKLMSKSLRMKYSPKLEFYLDEQQDQVASVIDTLNALSEESNQPVDNHGDSDE